jgi:mannose-6-phosphate isomerase-like protein (cupin superfamily)
VNHSDAARDASQIHNAATGEHIRFTSSALEHLIFENRIEGGKLQPPAHSHPHQSERFTLRSGAFELQIAGRWHTMHPGETLRVPPDTAHTFRIPANSQYANLEIEFSPALDSETVFRTMARAGRSGRIDLRYIGLIATQTQAGFHLSGLPTFVQRPLFRLLALLAQVRGLRLETAHRSH